MKTFVGFLIYLLTVLLLASGSLTFDLFKRRDFVVPRTVLADMNLTGMSRDEVKNMWRLNWQRFSEKPLQLAARGQVQTVTPLEFGIKINEAELFSRIPFASSVSNIEIVFWSIAGQRIMPDVMLEEADILRVVGEKFPLIPKTKNAYFVLRNGSMEIVEAQTGLELNVSALKRQIEQNAAFFDSLPLFADFQESLPAVSGLDLDAYRADIMENFPRRLILSHERQKWTVDFEKHPDWISFERQSAGAVGQLPFLMRWEPVSFSAFVNDNVVKSIEQQAEGVRIWRDPQGNIQFEGHGKDGRIIDMENLLIRINEALEEKTEEIEIPVLVAKPKIEISEDLQAMGIRDLISVGHTKYEGSPRNRIHNIGVGTNKFNGILIPPGETFSFSANVGPVDDTTGYRKELVIKPEGTIPEFGGGLCQVSTTMYRAVLYAGLPIVARTAHTYAVRYYAQVGGHGLDATVYPPSPDLKFTNDTPGYILIHSYIEGVSAYFKFFGTEDGRSVALDGPYISNRRSAPKEPMLIHDSKLRPGERKQVEKPHDGFDTVWYRYVTKNGETKKETILSRYQAVPAKFLVGEDITVGSTTEPMVNPFE